MNRAPIVKEVRAYDATEWEIFVGEWQAGLKKYLEVKRLGGAGDHGRDVIGIYTSQGCFGRWDNYQCKHYESPLGLPKACEDAGKIIFHAFNGTFLPPERCFFVAPRGPSTALRDMLLNPAKFRKEVLATWDTRVAKNVETGKVHSFTGDLRAYVEAYDFSSFGYKTLDEILDDHMTTAFWASRFDGLLPEAPAGSTPATVGDDETVYVGKLLEVYAEQTASPIKTVEDLLPHDQWKADLQKQRERFFDAEAFISHYRDQTVPGTVEDFADQVYDAIEPGLSLPKSALEHLTSALATASQVSPASVLSPRAKVRVKQGVCHQLANAKRVSWKP